MRRLSSAAGCNERDLNSTRVFWSQGARVVVTAPVIAALSVALLIGCRRAGPGKPEASTSDPMRAGEALPQRAPVPLPPLLPVPETVVVPATASLPRGGALRVHLDAEPMHLNPLADPDAAGLQVVSGLIYESLIDCPSPGTEGGYRPALAESWNTSADGMRIYFHLRSGVRWHDGHGFSVLDVQATLERLLLGGRGGVSAGGGAVGGGGGSSAILRASLQDVAGIEIVADRTVRLVLKRPSDFALRALCDVPILPDHVLRGATPDATALGRQPIGTGPFRFAAWDRGKRIKLVRAAAHWSGTPALDEITFEIDADGARALMRTRRGEIDILPRVLPAYFPEEVDPVTLHGALTLWRVHPERWAYVAVNHRHAPLGDVQVRRALSALWDRAYFARDLHRGLAHPIGAPPFAGLASLGGGRARAITELDAAGYGDTNADGVRELSGKPIRLSLLVAAGGRTALAEAHAFVFEARKVGLLVDLTTVDPGLLLARTRKGDFDLALMLWEGRPDEDPGLMFGSGGAFNIGGYRSPEVDGILDALRLATGFVQRRPLLASLGEVLAREQPVLFLYQFDRPTLVARRVHGLSALGDRMILGRVWVDP